MSTLESSASTFRDIYTSKEIICRCKEYKKVKSIVCFYIDPIVLLDE